MARRPRDSQRQALYRWESVIRRDLGPQNGWNKLWSLEECGELIQKISSDYGVTAPRLKDGRARGSACAYGNHAISLPRFARKPMTVIHEMAHIINWNKFDWTVAGHGKEFASLVLDMYKRYLGINHVKARKLGIVQRPRRVRFANMAIIPKPVKKIYKLKGIGEIAC